MWHTRHSTLGLVVRAALAAGAGLGLARPDQAHAQAALTGGTLYVASSWRGTPDVGYSNVSNSDTQVHGPTIFQQALSSLPLSVANNYISDYNGNGYRLDNQLSMNWGGNVEGPRDFTYDATVDETFTLSTGCNWTRHYGNNQFFGYTFFNLEDVGGGGFPTIDLLQTPSGYLPAGTYRYDAAASGAWSYSGLSFLEYAGMSVEFTTAPAPGGAAVLSLGLLAAARRRRR